MPNSSSASRTLVTALSVLMLPACGNDVMSSDAGVAGDGQIPSEGGTTTPTVCVPKPAAMPAAPRCTSNPSDTSLPACEQWVKVEPPGAVCSDGSQYKFFVNYASQSDNLVIMFEPGGACWDYASCTGGARGAANPHGIPDDHMANNQYLNLVRRTEDNPVHDWNLVFVSYCTGDVHAGDKVATYEDPAGGPALTYRHAGLANTEKVIEYLAARFPTIPQLFVTGCSAGGLGAIQNYTFIREGLAGTQCGYLLDDSGPAFHSNGPAKPLQDTVRDAWNLETLLSNLAKQLRVPLAELQDFGRLNTALADRYPSDRLSLSAYRMDFNYSLYSYERFFPGSTPADIHAKFWTDLSELLRSYDTRENLAYYVPYFRHDNCSHCVSIPPIGHDTTTILTMPWLGSEIASSNLDLRAFVVRLLDDAQPLENYLEDPKPGVDFTSDELAMCLKPTDD